MSGLSSPELSSPDEVVLLSSGGSVSISALSGIPPEARLPSTDMSWLAASLVAALLQASSAAAPKDRVRNLAAFCISEARAWLGFGTRQPAFVDLQRLISDPAPSLA